MNVSPRGRSVQIADNQSCVGKHEALFYLFPLHQGRRLYYCEFICVGSPQFLIRVGSDPFQHLRNIQTMNEITLWRPPQHPRRKVHKNLTLVLLCLALLLCCHQITILAEGKARTAHKTTLYEISLFPIL